MLKKTLSIIFAAGMLFSGASHAAFSVTDWKNTGDAKATLDSETGLEWLDVSYTNGWTVQSALNAIQPGGTLYGWRLPTKSEVTTLMNHWFGQSWTNFGIVYYSGWPASVMDFYHTFGITRMYGATSNGQWWSGGVYLDGSTVLGAGAYHRDSWGSHNAQAWVNDVTSYNVNSYIDGGGVFLVSDGGTTLSSINNPSLNANNPNSPVNNQPATDVPAPWGTAMFATLLAVAIRRKRT